MSDMSNHESNPSEFLFYAVCNDCGNIDSEYFDNKSCECGGIYHVNSARCLNCGKRHPFNQVGRKCSCEKEGIIVAKMVGCPSCKANMTIDHIEENCPMCNVKLRLEG